MGSTVQEFDDYRPCFFESGTEGEEDFYDVPAPSEDIWKKFELLPTPPRSPKHETNFNSLASPNTLEKLRLVSDILDDPVCKSFVFSEGFSVKCMDTCCNFNSKLIHDCMWSGNNIPDGLKIGNINNDLKVRSRSCSVSSTTDIITSSCVDPNQTGGVFPYPVSSVTTTIKSQPSLLKQMVSLGTETPSESEPESEDEPDDVDEQDEEEEEEEEIDVVTVVSTSDKITVKQRLGRERPVLPASPSFSAQVAAMHNYTAAAPRSPKSDSSSSSSRSSTSSHHGYKRHRTHHGGGPQKRAKITVTPVSHSNTEVRTAIHSYRHKQRPSNNSSRCSSDSEDSDCKRAQHNVLERKRRNDLKSSFHRLRDNVPDLQSQERAAKVTILKKATDHIMFLRRQQQTLNVELDRHQRTHEALQRRLRLLRSK